jgi:hypothetical protein
LKIKLSLIFAICLVLCLAGLGTVAFLARKDRNLMLMLPAEISSPRFDVQKIEEFSEDEFLLTYEIPSSERISLSHADYQVTCVATSSAYPQIMGFTMVEGSFFSKQAWAGEQRHAVLNEKAAFTIFGSSRIVGNRFRIRNDTWLVTGVINDEDEDRAKVYIPSSVRAGEAEALALISSENLDEAYVKNTIKTLGIRDSDFNFINFGTQYGLLWDRVEVILLLFFSFFFMSLLGPLIMGFIEALTTMKNDLTRLYVEDILKKNQKTVFRLGLLGLSTIVFPGLALFLFLRLASVCLPWQDIPSLADLNKNLFFVQLARISKLEMISRFFFGFAFAFLGAFFIGFNRFLIKLNPKNSKKALPIQNDVI